MAIITKRSSKLIKRKISVKKTNESTKNGLNKILRTFNSYLDKYEDHFVVEDVDPGRYYFLRPSSFPYCGFRKLLNANKDIDAPRLNTFASTYFTEIGHTTHHVFQLFGGLGGKLVGDWECKSCGNVRKFSCNNVCKCGSAMQYNELEVYYKGLVLGHIDGLFRLDPKLGAKSVHVLVDYKTTSTSKIKMTPRASPFPYKYNVQQIESYVPLAELQYNISIDYWLLIYLARDAPFKYGRAIRGAYLSVEDKEHIRKRIDRWVKTHKLVLTATTKKEFDRVEHRKLCKSLQDYKQNYKEEYNVCPFMDKCFDAPNTLITKALTYKIYPILEHAPKQIQRKLREII